MAMVTDILLDSTLDFQVVNGDFLIGESDEQHIQLLLSSSPGNWKQFPFLGTDLIEDIASPMSAQDIVAKITLAMKVDAFQNISVFANNGKIQVSGNH